MERLLPGFDGNAFDDNALFMDAVCRRTVARVQEMHKGHHFWWPLCGSRLEDD
jgi:hypothetical protein